MVSDIHDAEYFEGLQREVRAHNHDLYLAHLFVPADKRHSFIYLAHYYCELEIIRRSESELMLRLIRVQWWLDQFEKMRDGESGGLPMADYWLAHNLPIIWLENLAQHTMDELDGEADPSLNPNATSPLFANIADLLGYDLSGDIAIDAACGFWSDSVKLDMRDARFAMLKTAINAKTRAQRKTLMPILVLIKLARRRGRSQPKTTNALADLLSLVWIAIWGRL